MKIEKNDFVMVQGESDKKPYLVEVTESASKKIAGYLSTEERASQGDKKFLIECRPDDVVVNLGSEPPIGKTILGLRIEPFIDRIRLAPFAGMVAVLDPLPKADLKNLTVAAIRLKKKLKRYKATDHTRHWNVSVRPSHGSHSGMWKFHPKTGEERMFLYSGINSSVADWLYTMGHEFGHHVWARCMSSKQKARWIAIHRKALKFSEIPTSKITKYRSELEKVKSIKTFRKILRTLDKEEGLEGEASEHDKFILVLNASLKMCNAKAEDFDIIMESGGSLMDYWTKTPIPQVDRNVIITEYALTSPTELFCECVAHLLAGIEVPPKIKKITIGTFKKAIRRGFAQND